MRRLKTIPTAFFLLVVTTFFISSNAWAFDHNHSVFSELLSAHVKNGKVNYRKLKKNDGLLQSYIRTLEAVSVDEFESFNKDQKLAFYINAYNAYTLQVIIDHYPIKSIQDIGKAPGDVWKQKIVKLFKKNTSLHSLENRVIRQQFHVPEVHFALNCASKGCPPLLNTAYRARDLRLMLNRAAQRFIRKPAHNRYDAGTNRLYLSQIFSWYKDDFGGAGKLVAYYLRWASSSIKQMVAEQKSPQVIFLQYDWSLNE